MPKIVVFSDVDGTLLDHDTYSYRDAEPALELLRERGIPLVLVTSKTRTEVEPLRKELGNEDPFVVENGAALFFPRRGELILPPGSETRGDYDVVHLGVPYARVRAFIAGVRERFGMRGFGDMSDEEVANLTGLGLEAAHRARQREFSEPFLLRDDGDLDELEEVAADDGLAITTGGRLHHLIGAGQDKGKAVSLVRDAFGPTVAKTVGLGDGRNDLPMLEAVDTAVVVPRPDGTRLELARDDAVVAPFPGSRGWNAAVTTAIGERAQA